MFELDIPMIATLASIIGAITGAGGSYAVTKQKAHANAKQIDLLSAELKAHTIADAVAFNEIMRSLGRIEGTLQELKRKS